MARFTQCFTDRKTLRDRFEENYVPVPVPTDDPKGFKMNYVYYAAWYFWDVPKGRLRRIKWRLLTLSAVSLILFMALSTQFVALNMRASVFIPCTLALCCHIIELSGLVQFMFAHYRTTKITFQDIERIMGFAPMTRAAFTCAAGLACLWYLIHGEASPLSIGITIGFLALATAAWWESRYFQKIPIRTEENNTLAELEGNLTIPPLD